MEKLRVLVVGSGGREHALVWKLAQSKLVDKLFCAPGNAGISEIAECIDIKVLDIENLVKFAKTQKIDLTVVGPEAPLAIGLVDEFLKHKLRIFGPTKKAALLESSKSFAKQLMKKYNIPTADFMIFDDPASAKKYIERITPPYVIKADGLAAGKGVIVAKTIEEAYEAISLIMEKKIFGEAGKKVVIEEYLEGQEASIMIITDSKEVLALESSQDHKRVFDNDLGPNTGGMGAYSPTPMIDKTLYNQILETIIYRTIDALVKEDIIYNGVLYAGIMLTKKGPKVLEFNVRFGDPETQVVLPRLLSDFCEIVLATANNKLSKFLSYEVVKWDSRSCVCVVCASCGYPDKYQVDKEIFGLDEVKNLENIIVFHAGTKKVIENNKTRYFTNGGRVLGVVGLAITLKEAIINTYKAVEKIHFEGMHYRKDIGQKALKLFN